MTKVYRCLRSLLLIIEMLFYLKNNKANFWVQTSNFILNDPIAEKSLAYNAIFSADITVYVRYSIVLRPWAKQAT